MNKKYKIILLGFLTSCGVGGLGLPFLTNTHKNNIEHNLVNNEENAIRTNNTVKTVTEENVYFNENNYNDNADAPNGIIKVSSESKGFYVHMTSYFNHNMWKYYVNDSKSIIRQNGKNIQAKSVKTKYNKFWNAVVVFGSGYTNGSGNTIEHNFMFMLDADTGEEIIFGSNRGNSVLYGDNLDITGSKKIQDIVINPNDGRIVVLYEGNSWIKEKKLVVVDSSFNAQQYDISSSIQESGLVENEANILAHGFVVNENIWGIQTIWNAETSIDGKVYKKNTIQLFLFNFEGNFISKSEEDVLSKSNWSESNQNLYNENIDIHELSQPIVMPFIVSGVKKYKIVYSSIHDVSTIKANGFSRQANIGSDILKIITFDPTNNSKLSIDKIELKSKDGNINSTDQSAKPIIIISLDYDVINNSLLIVSYDSANNNENKHLQSQPLTYYINYLEFDQSSNLNCTNYFYKTSNDSNFFVPTLNVLRDNRASKGKLNLILQESKYVFPSRAQDPTEVNYFYTKMNLSSTKNQNWEWKKWNRVDVVKNDFRMKKWWKENSINKKLPSDISDEEIIKWRPLVKVGSSSSDDIDLSEEQYKPDYDVKYKLVDSSYEDGWSVSNTSKKMYKNNDGAIKFSIQVDIKKWWIDDKDDFYTIHSNHLINQKYSSGFYKTSDFNFELVNDRNDPSKWAEINSLKTKSASSVKHQEILDKFIIKGEAINLTVDDISINGRDENGYEIDKTLNKAINVRTDDEIGVLVINVDITGKTSESMTSDKVITNQSYYGFKVNLSRAPLVLDENKFNQMKKNRLAYSISLNDMLSCIKIPAIYNDITRWKFTYEHQDDPNGESYIKNLVEGRNKIKLEYKRESDIPTNIPDTDLKLELTDAQAKGFMKLEDVIGKQIIFNNQKALELTSTSTKEYIRKNILNILRLSYDFDKGKDVWFNIDTEIVATESKIDNNTITFNLSFKDDVIKTNILVYNTESNNTTNLVMNDTFRTNLKKFMPKLLSDFNEVALYYDLIQYEWNYGISKTELSPSIPIEKLINESQIANKEIEINELLASYFVDYFYSVDKNGLIFNKTFNLLKTNVKNSSNNFEIEKIVLLADDKLGVVTANYFLNYPSIGQKINTSINIVGFKNSWNKVKELRIILPIIGIAIIITIIISIIVFVYNSKKRKHYKEY